MPAATLNSVAITIAQAVRIVSPVLPRPAMNRLAFSGQSPCPHPSLPPAGEGAKRTRVQRRYGELSSHQFLMNTCSTAISVGVFNYLFHSNQASLP